MPKVKDRSFVGKLSTVWVKRHRDGLFSNFGSPMKRIVLLLFWAVWALPSLQAQHSLGLVVGDLNTPYAYSLNPALSRSSLGNRAFFNWWGGGFAASSGFEMGNLDQDWIPGASSKAYWRLNAMNEVYGPSFFLPLGPRASFGFGVKAVAGTSFTGVSKEWAQALRYGTTSEGIYGLSSLDQGAFSINSDQYQEWFFSFSGESEAWSEGWSAASLAARQKAYRWGITPKFIIGMGAASLQGASLKLKDIQNDALNEEGSAIAEDVRLRLSYSDDPEQSVATVMQGPWGLNFRIPYGAGMGLDLGFVYEYRPRAAQDFSSLSPCDWEEKQQYDWKIGASLTDLGLIWYDGSVYALNQQQNATVNWQNQSNPGFEQRVGFLANSYFVQNGSSPDPSGFVSYTPAALNVQFDKRLAAYQHWHLGAYWTQDVKAVNASGIHRASYFSVVPRKQTERWEYGFPLSLTQGYSELQLGAYLRIGPLTLGSDNLVGYRNWQAGKGMSGANFYFGVRSKIGDCSPWWSESYEEPVYQDSQRKEPVSKLSDTVYVERVVTVRDTIWQLKTDTLRLRDTIVKRVESPVSPVDPAADRVLEDCQQKLTQVQAELNKQNKRNQDLQDEMAQQKKQCQEALMQEEDKRKKAELALEEAKNKLNEVEQERNRLAYELDRLKNSEGKSCQEQTRMLDSLLAMEQKRNQNLTAELYKTRSERDKAVADAQACQKQSESCNKTLAEVQAERDRLKKEVANLSAQLANPTEDCTPIKQKLAETEAKLKAVEADLQASKSKAAACESELAVAKKKAADLSATVSNLEKQVADLKNQLAAASGEDCSAYKAKIQSLEAQLAAVEDCSPYKKKVSELEAQLAAVEDCAPYKKKAADLEAKLAQSQSDLEAQKKKVAELEAKLANGGTGDDAQQIKAELEAAKKKIASLEAENASLKSENAQLESDLTAAKNQYNAVMAEYEVCNKSVQELKTKLANCEKQLKEESNNDSDAALQEAKAEIAKLKQTLAQMNAEIASQKETIEACQSNNAELMDKLKAAQTLSEKLKSQLLEANKQIQQLQSQLEECKKGQEAMPPAGPGSGGN